MLLKKNVQHENIEQQQSHALFYVCRVELSLFFSLFYSCLFLCCLLVLAYHIIRSLNTQSRINKFTVEQPARHEYERFNVATDFITSIAVV